MQTADSHLSEQEIKELFETLKLTNSLPYPGVEVFIQSFKRVTLYKTQSYTYSVASNTGSED